MPGRSTFDSRTQARSLAFLFAAAALVGCLTVVFPHEDTVAVGPVTAVSGTNPNTATASGTNGTTVMDVSTATYATTGLTIAKSCSGVMWISCVTARARAAAGCESSRERAADAREPATPDERGERADRAPVEPEETACSIVDGGDRRGLDAREL